MYHDKVLYKFTLLHLLLLYQCSLLIEILATK